MNTTFFSELHPAARIFLGCLLLLILAIPFDEGGNGLISQSYTQAVLLFCAMIWALRTLHQKQLCLTIVPLDWIVCGALLWCSANALFWSPYRYGGLLELVKIGSYFAVFMLCRQLLPLRRRRSLLLFTIFGSCVLHMALAWTWYLNGQRRLLQADFVNPNNFACFLVFGVNIGLSFLLFAAQQHSRRRYSHLLHILLGGLICGLIGTILQVGSRGAALSVLGSGFILFGLKKRRLAFLFLILLCLASFIPISGTSIFERLQKRSDSYAYERVGIWKSSLKIALDHPLSGVGLGQFGYAARAYNFPVEHTVARYGKNINSAHNDLLQIFAEQGVPGLGLAVGALGILAFYALRSLQQRPFSWTDAAAFAMLMGFLIQSSFSYLLASPALAVVFTLACVLLLDSDTPPASKTLTFKASPLWYLLTLLLGTYILLYAIIYPLLGHRQYLRYSRLKREGELLQAIPHLQSAIDHVPIHPFYYYKLGSLYMDAFKKAPNLELFEKAEAAFDAALRYHPHNDKYYETRGILYKERFYTLSPQNAIAEKALRDYELALQYNPFSPFLLFSKAMIHADIEQFDRALELLHQAIAIEPNFVGGHQMIGKMLTHLGRQAEAEGFFQKGEEIRRKYAARAAESRYVNSLLRTLQ